MSWLKKYLNYAGLVLVVLSFILLIVWPQYQKIALTLALSGLVLLVLYLILNLSGLKQSLQRRSFLYSGNMLLIIILVLGLLVVANFFLARHHYRLDFTAARIHSLSDQSIQVVKNLNQDILIKAFFREGNAGRTTMDNLLKIYAYHSPRIKYEFIDPDKNPGLVKKYGITEDGTTVFELGEKENRITTASEEDITNAIIKLTRERKKVIYFLEGHGEDSIEETGETGFSTAKGELEKIGYEIKKLPLALSSNFPGDCSLLVVPGPKAALLPNELDTLKQYLDQGGRILFLIDPETATGLEPWLLTYGIKLENDIVVDRVSRLLGGDYFMPAVTEYQTHEITKNFRYATFYPLARSVELADSKPEGLTLTIIARTSANAWSERQLEQQEVSFDPAKDKAGPVSLAVAGSKTVTITNPDKSTATPDSQVADSSSNRELRLAVFGDSDFMSNKYYNFSGNGNFFLNTVNWLTQEEDLISIQPRTQIPRTIQMTPSQGRLLMFVSIILLPALVLMIGLGVWLKRRSL
ncbi:MAG: GldG family protein [Acidobacteriota bacterium]|nr:GldG family protein [Acidobacteriota bacterium]